MNVRASIEQTAECLGLMYKALASLRERKEQTSAVMYALQADGVLIEIERLKAELDELVDLEETKRIIGEVGAQHAEKQASAPAALAA
jgi:hypothetical protein